MSKVLPRYQGHWKRLIAGNTSSSRWLSHNYNRRPWEERLDLKPVIHDKTLIMHACQRILFNKRDIGSAASCIQPKTISSALEPCQCPRGTNATDLSNKMTIMLHEKVGSANARFDFEKCKSCLTQYSVALHEQTTGVLEVSLDAWTTIMPLNRDFSGCTHEPS